MKQIGLLVLSVLILHPIFLGAQVVNRDIYKAEIGLIGGGSFYLGDANSTLFSNTQPAYGGYFRYVINSRIAFRAELTANKISGSGFKHNVNSGDICAEYNFFDLEKNPYKRFSKIYSPYLFTGLGIITNIGESSNQLPRLSLPFGIGLKLKLGNRWNLNAQWSNKILLNSDNMEKSTTLNNPNELNGTNIFNNDLLSTITVGISYDIWKKKCDCLNSYSN